MDLLKPRQLDIMQNLAAMLGQKGPVKITTALLANQCGITEAAIYRHFPSKRKIYSGLVDFCEQNILTLLQASIPLTVIILKKTKKILNLLVNFSEKNPGLARLLTREAFSIDETTLDERIGQMMSKIELIIKQNLQKYEQTTKAKLALPTASSANLLLASAEGFIQQFVRSGFQDAPSKRVKDQFEFLVNALVAN